MQDGCASGFYAITIRVPVAGDRCQHTDALRSQLRKVRAVVETEFGAQASCELSWCPPAPLASVSSPDGPLRGRLDSEADLCEDLLDTDDSSRDKLLALLSPAQATQLGTVLDPWRPGAATTSSISIAQRGQLWAGLLNAQSCALAARDLARPPPSSLPAADHPPHSYLGLLYRAAQQAPPACREIAKDLHRTGLNGSEATLAARARQKRLLVAFAKRNEKVGYCQGMNFLTAMLLRHFVPAFTATRRACASAMTKVDVGTLPAEDIARAEAEAESRAPLTIDVPSPQDLCEGEERAFWALVLLVEQLLPDFYSADMLGVRTELRVLSSLVAARQPALHTRLGELRVQMAFIATEWLVGVFSTAMPANAPAIWDLFFVLACEYPPVDGQSTAMTTLMATALALLTQASRSVLDDEAVTDCGTAMRAIKNLCSDLELQVELDPAGAWGDSTGAILIRSTVNIVYELISDLSSLVALRRMHSEDLLRESQMLQQRRDFARLQQESHLGEGELEALLLQYRALQHRYGGAVRGLSVMHCGQLLQDFMASAAPRLSWKVSVDGDDAAFVTPEALFGGLMAMHRRNVLESQDSQRSQACLLDPADLMDFGTLAEGASVLLYGSTEQRLQLLFYTFSSLPAHDRNVGSAPSILHLLQPQLERLLMGLYCSHFDDVLVAQRRKSAESVASEVGDLVPISDARSSLGCEDLFEKDAATINPVEQIASMSSEENNLGEDKVHSAATDLSEPPLVTATAEAANTMPAEFRGDDRTWQIAAALYDADHSCASSWIHDANTLLEMNTARVQAQADAQVAAFDETGEPGVSLSTSFAVKLTENERRKRPGSRKWGARYLFRRTGERKNLSYVDGTGDVQWRDLRMGEMSRRAGEQISSRSPNAAAPVPDVSVDRSSTPTFGDSAPPEDDERQSLQKSALIMSNYFSASSPQTTDTEMQSADVLAGGLATTVSHDDRSSPASNSETDIAPAAHDQLICSAAHEQDASTFWRRRGTELALEQGREPSVKLPPGWEWEEPAWRVELGGKEVPNDVKRSQSNVLNQPTGRATPDAPEKVAGSEESGPQTDEQGWRYSFIWALDFKGRMSKLSHVRQRVWIRKARFTAHAKTSSDLNASLPASLKMKYKSLPCTSATQENRVAGSVEDSIASNARLAARWTAVEAQLSSAMQRIEQLESMMDSSSRCADPEETSCDCQAVPTTATSQAALLDLMMRVLGVTPRRDKPLQIANLRDLATAHARALLLHRSAVIYSTSQNDDHEQPSVRSPSDDVAGLSCQEWSAIGQQDIIIAACIHSLFRHPHPRGIEASALTANDDADEFVLVDDLSHDASISNCNTGGDSAIPGYDAEAQPQITTPPSKQTEGTTPAASDNMVNEATANGAMEHSRNVGSAMQKVRRDGKGASAHASGGNEASVSNIASTPDSRDRVPAPWAASPSTPECPRPPSTGRRSKIAAFFRSFGGSPDQGDGERSQQPVSSWSPASAGTDSRQEHPADAMAYRQRFSTGISQPMLMEGWLQKRGTLNRAWKKRWFVLERSGALEQLRQRRPRQLKYYKAQPRQRDEQPRGTISLQSPLRLTLQQPDEAVPPGSPACFLLECGDGDGSTSSRMWELRAANEHEREQWMRAIDPSYQFAIRT